MHIHTHTHVHITTNTHKCTYLTTLTLIPSRFEFTVCPTRLRTIFWPMYGTFGSGRSRWIKQRREEASISTCVMGICCECMCMICCECMYVHIHVCDGYVLWVHVHYLLWVHVCTYVLDVWETNDMKRLSYRRVWWVFAVSVWMYTYIELCVYVYVLYMCILSGNGGKRYEVMAGRGNIYVYIYI